MKRIVSVAREKTFESSATNRKTWLLPVSLIVFCYRTIDQEDSHGY